jgi:calcineurin-like phosphoesterase family protein
MNEFVTADCHFGHKNICKHTPHAPWSTVDEWDDGLIANWNAVVKKGDLVRIIGDFAFINHAKYFHRLNGNKILVRGSHDKMNLETLRACTTVELDTLFGWLRNFRDVYHKDLAFTFNGKPYYAVHTCPRIWERSHYGVPCLFGHSHGRLETWNLSFDIGVSTALANFAPINMEVVEREVARRAELMEQAGRVIRSEGKVIYRQDDVAYAMRLRQPEGAELLLHE